MIFSQEDFDSPVYWIILASGQKQLSEKPPPNSPVRDIIRNLSV